MNTEYFTARDSNRLAYKWFPAQQTTNAKFDVVLVCLHGATMNNLRYVALGRICQSKGISVCLPDWRGHGESQGKSGDLDYKGQLQDDLQDLVQHLKAKGAIKIVLGGHSAGSLVALGYIDQYGCTEIDGYVAISPPLSKTNETSRFDYEGDRLQYYARYLRKKQYHRPLSEAAAKYLPKMNLFKYFVATLTPFCKHSKVMQFPEMGPSLPNDKRVYEYSYTLIEAYTTNQYPAMLEKITVPCRFITGELDEVTDANLVHHIRNWYIHPRLDCDTIVLPRSNHMSVIMPSAYAIANWLSQWLPQNQEAA